MLSEPASALTDLALGMVAIILAVRLRPARHLTPHWARTFWWTGAAALAGAVHHGVVTHSDRWDDRSWLVVTFLVVVAISYLLAASVDEVLGPGHVRAFWLLRSGSLVAYVVVALTAGASIGAILACEAVTMVAVLAVWGIGIRRRHPRARAVATAIVASAAAAVIRALPPELVEPTGLDPTSLYHLAQIPGLILLYSAVANQARPVVESSSDREPV